MKTHRPWGAYALRLLCSGLMFVSAYALLAGSTFALRMREDAPVGTIVLALCALLSIFPLLMGRRYLTGMAASAFLLAGIGAYWWTTIPWDEFIKKSGFPTSSPATLLDYALVASPAVVMAFCAVVGHASTLKADLRTRGAERDEASRAACASFLSGAVLLVLCGALSAGLWMMMASDLVFTYTAPIEGIPALVFAAALVSISYALIARRFPRFRPRRTPAPEGTQAPRATAASILTPAAVAEPRRTIFARRRGKKAGG